MAPCVTVTQIHPVEAHSFLSFSPRIELCLSGQPGGRRSQRLLHLSPLLVNKPPQNNQTSLCPPWLRPNLPCPFTCPLHPHLCHLVMLCFFSPLHCAHCLSNKCQGSQASSVPEKAQIRSASPFSPPSSEEVVFYFFIIFRRELRHFTRSELWRLRNIYPLLTDEWGSRRGSARSMG